MIFEFTLEEWERDDDHKLWNMRLMLERVIQQTSMDHDQQDDIISRIHQMDYDEISFYLRFAERNKLNPIRDIGIYSVTQAAKAASKR